jgi:hypothetical protein
MISRKALIYIIILNSLVIFIQFIEVSAGSLVDISEVDKEILLEWVNDHCGKEFSSFDKLLKDRRIECKKNKKNEEVPSSYYQLDGHRHVRPHSLGAFPILWVPIPVLIAFYLFIVKIDAKKKRKTNHFSVSIRLLILAAPWITGVYAATIYQDQFLKQNVNFVRMHGHGKFNLFLLRICSNDLFFHGNPVVHAAVDTGSLEMVKFVVEEMNMNPNQMYLDVLPLALAANHRMTDIVDYLIKYFPDNPKEGGEYFFKTAILLGRSDYIRQLLKYDFIKKHINDQKPGVPWISRRSALFLAVFSNYIEIAVILLDNGADPKLPNAYDNKTPIDAAKQNANIEMQNILKEYSDKKITNNIT